jgi:hypothetical protein
MSGATRAVRVETFHRVSADTPLHSSGAGRPAICHDGCVKRGRILAIKWGMNPNSSSLGVDVTFLLLGATALAMVTPVIGALLRWRKPAEPKP